MPVPHPATPRSRVLLTLALGLLAALLATGAARAAPAPSDPALQAPPLTVLHSSPRDAPGLLFFAPKIETAPSGQQGPEIADESGRPVWFHALPAGVQATDFRVQSYRGRQVLTWWQGSSHSGPGHGEGVDEIADRSYHVIATVAAGNGYDADSHEFRLTPQGTALITSYHEVPYDLSSVGGPKDGEVFDGIVQEVDVATGKVLLEWHSLDHVPLGDSHVPAPTTAGTPYDYFHINAVNLDSDGNLLVSARHTWTIYKLDRHTGAVIWQLGGRHSDFTLGAGVQFAWQHNALPAGRHTIRIFDNESNGTAVLPVSRIEWIHLSLRHHTARLVRSITHPDGLSAPSQGNAQDLGDGHTFVGWGQLGRISELGRDGGLLFDAQLPAGYDTYRAYRFPWSARPDTAPTASVARGGTTVDAIWNGATDVSRWVVLGGDRRHELHPLAQAPWNGLDTPIAVHAAPRWVEVLALDAHGHPLGDSEVTATS